MNINQSLDIDTLVIVCLTQTRWLWTASNTHKPTLDPHSLFYSLSFSKKKR